MAIRIPRVPQSSKQLLKSFSHSSNSVDVPKGHLAVYVGEELQKRRFVVLVTYLSHPSFQNLLREAEEEFGFDHPMGTNLYRSRLSPQRLIVHDSHVPLDLTRFLQGEEEIATCEEDLSPLKVKQS